MTDSMANGDEIEITPEMIEAGTDILADVDPEYGRLQETVIKILRAAFEVRASHASLTPEPHSQL